MHNKTLKKMKKGSGNYRVLEYMMSNSTPISVADARELGLTNDLRSRVSDLKNKYGVDISSKVVEGATGAKYKIFWLGDSVLRDKDETINIKVKFNNSYWEGKFYPSKEIILYANGKKQQCTMEQFEKNLGGLIEKV